MFVKEKKKYRRTKHFIHLNIVDKDNRRKRQTQISRK